jgi:hypothetical protein
MDQALEKTYEVVEQLKEHSDSKTAEFNPADR